MVWDYHSSVCQVYFLKYLSATFKRKCTFRAVFVSQKNCTESLTGSPSPCPHIHSLLNHRPAHQRCLRAMMSLEPSIIQSLEQTQGVLLVLHILWTLENIQWHGPTIIVSHRTVSLPQILCPPIHPPALPQSPGHPRYFKCLHRFAFSKVSYGGNQAARSLSASFLSLHEMHWGFLQGISGTNSSFLLRVEEYLIVWMRPGSPPRLTHSPTEGHLGGSQVLVIVNNAPMATPVQECVRFCVQCLLVNASERCCWIVWRECV